MESPIGSFLSTIRSLRKGDTSHQLLGLRNPSVMRDVLLLLVIYALPKSGQSANGVIWKRSSQNFVSLFSVPAFAAINQELVNQSRAQETHNFQGQVVRITFYEMIHVVTSEANGTKVGGVFGEVWSTLSKLSNFTLKPIVTGERTMGLMNPNGTYTFGLMKIIQRNETEVIPRMETNTHQIKACQYTVPLWPIRYHLYTRLKMVHNPIWMLKLFSYDVWYAILFTYLLLTFCSYLIQTVVSKTTNRKHSAGLGDHLFYNFGLMCEQTDLSLHDSSACLRIVDLWLGLFSFLIRAAFGALLIKYMTQTTFTPPFKDLESLLKDTSYEVVVMNGSRLTKLVEGPNEVLFENLIETNRVTEVNNYEEMFRKVCSPNKSIAMHHNLGIKNSIGKYQCRIDPVGAAVHRGHIISGISRNFRNKRSIDIGIIKLREYGIIHRLSNVVKGINHERDIPLNKVEPIYADQVYLILVILASGALVSVIFLVLEVLVFYYNN